MRTLIATFATALLLSAGVASARDFDPSVDANTSLSSLPMHVGNTATLSTRAKKEPTVAAKYDSSFPVRDKAPMPRERGAI